MINEIHQSAEGMNGKGWAANLVIPVFLLYKRTQEALASVCLLVLAVVVFTLQKTTLSSSMHMRC